MLFIVSDSTREAALLATLCEQRSWPCQTCAAVTDFGKLAEKNSPRAVVVRQRLRDGYSDDIFAALKQSDATQATRVIVLVSADFSIHQEARQVMLGADCVLRDPIRMEVLFAYLAKYRGTPHGAPLSTSALPLHYEFAGAQVFPHEHRLIRRNQSIQIAPQEIELLRLLFHSAGKVMPYPVIYSEMFNQRFAGDTANCRVLLGKVTASFRQLGINLRTFIEVIPKSGYLYTPANRKLQPQNGKSQKRVVSSRQTRRK